MKDTAAASLFLRTLTLATQPPRGEEAPDHMERPPTSVSWLTALAEVLARHVRKRAIKRHSAQPSIFLAEAPNIMRQTQAAPAVPYANT